MAKSQKTLERERKQREAQSELYTMQRERELQLAFYQIPEPYRMALQRAAILAIVDAFNHHQMKHGDGIGLMLPQHVITSLLDWYFDENRPNEIPMELLGDA